MSAAINRPSEVLGDLDEHIANAHALAHLTFRLVLLPHGDDINDPTGSTQQVIACVDALLTKMKAMEATSAELTEALHGFRGEAT